MILQGLTSEFSLPELFKFLQDSQQTGRLSLKPIEGKKLEGRAHFFWFEKGNLLAASSRLDGLGLLHILQERSLLRTVTLSRLLRQCPPRVALGKFLQERAILTSKQLKALFASQIVRHTRVLLKAMDVRFSFNAHYPFPYLEMTGIKIRATDITLPSLRVLKDWGNLLDKLPNLESGLKCMPGEIPAYRLHSKEKDVLRLAKDGLPVSKIASVLKLPTLEVRKIGFRLIFVGLVKEVPLTQFSRPATQPKRQASKQVSNVFLSKLSNYLQKTSPLAGASDKGTVWGGDVPQKSAPNRSTEIANRDKTAVKNYAAKRVKNVIDADRAKRRYENSNSVTKRS
ncbi:MAG: DUF4388 domain-containing protein [Phormidesmis sp.]